MRQQFTHKNQTYLLKQAFIPRTSRLETLIFKCYADGTVMESSEEYRHDGYESSEDSIKKFIDER